MLPMGDVGSWETDYTKLSPQELITALRDDAHRWATAFCQHAAVLGTPVDYEWAVTWFANAIEGSDEFRRRLRHDD